MVKYLTRKEERMLLNLWHGMLKKKNSFFIHAIELRRIKKEHFIKAEDFVKAESFGDRDKVCRILAAECFQLAQKFSKGKKQKLSLQYMKLAAKLLGMSLKPKKLEDIEAIKKALAELKAEEEPEQAE